MSKFSKWFSRFTRNVESVDCSPRPEEQIIDGRAFVYSTHDLKRPVTLAPYDRLTCTVNSDLFGSESISEVAAVETYVDAVAIFRAKDAFGMTGVIGGAFGKRSR